MKKFTILALSLIIVIITGYFLIDKEEEKEFLKEEPSYFKEDVVSELNEKEDVFEEEMTKSEEILPKEESFVVKESISEVDKRLKEIVKGFVGFPYTRGPLGEGDDEFLYRTDAFDCTTLVLVSVSKLHSNGLPAEEMIKRVNYYPQGEVSYETRLHFSTYRNKVSEYFDDITKKIAPENYKEKRVVLNKKIPERGRLIDIDWEEEVVFSYIETKDIHSVVSELPHVVGVAFLNEGDEDIGLDVRHEGFLFEGKDMVHASLNRGEVFQEDFLQFMENSTYDGVTFFKII